MALAYQPPFEDVAFLLGRWLRIEQDWRRSDRHAALDVDTAEAVLIEAGRFCAEVLAPINGSGDREGCHLVEGRVRTPSGFRQAYRRFVEDGWAALSHPPELGGQGLPGMLELAFSEMQVAANHAWAMYPGLLAGAVACLHAHGSPELQQRYLPRLVSGEWLATMCLTEPQAGSDLALLRCQAQVDGSSWRINGSKLFISGGSQDLTDNIVHLVLARLPHAPPGTRGVSLFVVPDVHDDGQRNGVFCDGIEHKMGIHGSATTSLRFEQAQGWLVGEPNRGLAAMFVVMNSARLHAAMQGLGHLDRARSLAQDYASQRRQMRTQPRTDPEQAADLIAAHPSIRHVLATLQGWTEAMRAAGYWLAHQIDLAQDAPEAKERERAQALAELLTPVAKAYFTEQGHLLADRALQVFGGYGYVSEYGIEQVVRDSRVACIYEGTNEIQALDLLQRKILADDGARLGIFAEICELVISEAHEKGLASQASQLARMLSRLQRTLRWVMRESPADPQLPFRVAECFLRATGHLLLAYACLRTALVTVDDGDTALRQRHERALWMLGELRLDYNAQVARIRSGCR